jgi:hypothetical protein
MTQPFGIARDQDGASGDNDFGDRRAASMGKVERSNPGRRFDTILTAAARTWFVVALLGWLFVIYVVGLRALPGKATSTLEPCFHTAMCGRCRATRSSPLSGIAVLIIVGGSAGATTVCAEVPAVPSRTAGSISCRPSS